MNGKYHHIKAKVTYLWSEILQQTLNLESSTSYHAL